MRLKHELPILAGTDIWPNAIAPPPLVKVFVYTEKPIKVGDDPFALAQPIIAKHAGTILGFCKSQRINRNAGIVPVTNTSLSDDEFEVMYSDLQGQEIVTVNVYPTSSGGTTTTRCLMVLYEGFKVAAIPMTQLDKSDFSPTYVGELSGFTGGHWRTCQIKPFIDGEFIYCPFAISGDKRVVYKNDNHVAYYSDYAECVPKFAYTTTAPSGWYPIISWNGTDLWANAEHLGFTLKDGFTQGATWSWSGVRPSQAGFTENQIPGPSAFDTDGTPVVGIAVGTQYEYAAFTCRESLYGPTSVYWCIPEPYADEWDDYYDDIDSNAAPGDDVAAWSRYNVAEAQHYIVKVIPTDGSFDVSQEVPYMQYVMGGNQTDNIKPMKSMFTVTGTVIGSEYGPDSITVRFRDFQYDYTSGQRDGQHRHDGTCYIEFPPSIGDSENYFEDIENNSLRTPYETIATPSSGQNVDCGFRGWLHVSNGKHCIQAYYTNNTPPVIWMNRNDVTALIADALKTTVRDIQTMLMDIDLTYIRQLS